MFDSNITHNTSITKTSVSFNAPATGIIQKSAPKSRFVRFAQGSRFEDNIFGIAPVMFTNKEDEDRGYASERKPITILQVLLTTNNGFLVEYIFDEDIID